MNLLALTVRFTIGFISRCRNLYYRNLGVQIRGYVWLRKVSIPRQWSDITLEGSVSLDDGVTLVCSGPPRADKILVRSGTYINRQTILDAHEHVEIGRDCLIGPGCFITDSSHGIADGTAPAKQSCTALPTIIEDEVWIGAHVVVLAGVRIGKGAVVGAGAVVTKSVEPFQIVAGVPARVLGTRKKETQSGEA